MSATYLIDGYNLLHALGILPHEVGPHGLERARQRLLDFLQAAHGPRSAAVTVIFDAASAPPGAVRETDQHGIHVRFALGYEQADDLIEELIRSEPAPQQLHVVSDDQRIQRAARRGRCQALGCADYLELLERSRRPCRPTPPPEKHGQPSQAETQQWLNEFADLDKEPDWKELFPPYPFEEGPEEGAADGI
jgi:predicted RNA-binding protein with PIN domain